MSIIEHYRRLTLTECCDIVESRPHYVMFDMWRGDGTAPWSLVGDMESCVRHAYRGRDQGFVMFRFRVMDSADGNQFGEYDGADDGGIFDILFRSFGIANEADLDKHIRSRRADVPGYTLMADLLYVQDDSYVLDDDDGGDCESCRCPPPWIFP